MLSNRELSERLESLACRVKKLIDKDYPPPDSQEFEEMHKGLLEVVTELHLLSNEKYEVHNSWQDLQKTVPSTGKKKPYLDTSGREFPF